MKFLKYFFYLAWNWNLRLAFFVLRHELRGERHYHQNTVGVNDLTKELTSEELHHASIYQPVNYYTAEQLFDQTFLEDVEGTLLDLGCGMGRVFGIAAAYGFKKMIGVDISAKLCAEAAITVAGLEKTYPDISIEIHCANASDFEIPSSVSTIFLFNPFDHSVMRKMLKNLGQSVLRNPRPLKILYANPVCKNIFTEAGYVETFYFQKMKYLEGSVLEKE